MLRLQDQYVLILGLGASGLAMARWCALAGAKVTVADSRDNPPGLQLLQSQWPHIRCLAGPLGPELLQGAPYGAVFRSPGLAPASIAPLLAAVRAQGLYLGGELDLFMQALGDLQLERSYAPKLLAVTGTNGKTTVTALTGQLLERSARRVAVAGNIGPTLLDTLREWLVRPALPEVWVLELSSFQLDACAAFEPSAAVVLNLSQDHLDWHENMPAYATAKARVFGQQALMLLNRDDPLVMAMLPAPTRLKQQRPQQRAYITFGAGLPQRPGDFGIEEVNGVAWLVRAMEADDSLRPRRGETQDLHLQRLIPADALRIRGRHNALNALAALALCQSVRCALGPLLYGLREYRGEPHRVAAVANINGVEFFDDSKGTNVGATSAALHGLGLERRLVAILGGEGKGQDFSPLVEPVTRFARAVVLIGRDAGLISATLLRCGVPLVEASSMADAVGQAAALAQPGDAVLMSPACASFDMFDNYQHRGDMFIAAVNALAADAGALPSVEATQSTAGPPQGGLAPPGGSAAHAVASVGATPSRLEATA